MAADGPVDGDGDNDLLILSGPGRFLWVRLDLLGDGYSTPSVSSLRLEYPRNSYLRFLPAVYSADPGSADFLARFLAIAQTHIEDIEARLADMPALFDPLAVPGPLRRLPRRLAGRAGRGHLDQRAAEAAHRRHPRLLPQAGDPRGYQGARRCVPGAA